MITLYYQQFDMLMSCLASNITGPSSPGPTRSHQVPPGPIRSHQVPPVTSRGVGTILKVGAPISISRKWALIVQKSGGARLYVLPYFHPKVGGPGPPRPIPLLRPCVAQWSIDYASQMEEDKPLAAVVWINVNFLLLFTQPMSFNPHFMLHSDLK